MLSLYIHFPFCTVKCPYCDFYSLAKSYNDSDALFEAYKRDLYKNYLSGRTLSSIFFGGGTPSLMDIKLIERLLNFIKTLYIFDDSIEITLECNPREYKFMKDFRSVGINRLSVGIQSIRQKNLEFLKRDHSSDVSYKAIDTAIATFDNVSFDFIYALQDQTLYEWEEELNEIVSFNPKHLSLYQLTIEEGTIFHKLNIKTPKEELSEKFFDMTNSITSSNGLDAYEISNYSKKGFESKHNLTYWRYLDYVGIGPSAHGRYLINNKKVATSYPRNFEKWISEDCLIIESLDEKIVSQEKIMMGLRLSEGILIDSKLKDLSKPLVNQEYAVTENDYLKLTYEGRKRHSAIVKWLFDFL